MGTNLVEALKQGGYTDVTPLSRRNYDLVEQTEVRRMFKELKPEILIHLAAKIGGIKANKDFPGDFFYTNASMNVTVMHEAFLAGVEKYITCIGGCSYPAAAPSPIKETSLWNGYPQAETASYSVAKMMAVTQARAYRAQYGFNAVVLLLGNLYGPHDNYNLENSHVIAALVRKIYEARERKTPQLVAWGSGKPLRDFMYVKDAVQVMILGMEKYNQSEIINLSSGVQTTIKELYELAIELCEYRGLLVWDTSKPDGQLYKGFDVTRMKTLLGFDRITPLRDGLQETIRWFAANHDKSGAVRL